MLELVQIDGYDTFKDKGNLPSNQESSLRITKHNAQLFADGHRTEFPTEIVYSSVVSLKTVRLVIFLVKFNHLVELWGTDIGNACLESYTN